MSDSKSAPAGSSSSESATKARIIAHMNRDHTAELSHYLRAFNGVPASAARTPQLTDLALDSLTIRTSPSTSHVVRIAPPMASLADARARTVEMAQRARQQLGLGLSPVRVTAFAWPESAALAGLVGASVVAMSVCTLGLGLGLAQPGSALEDVAGRWGGPGAAGYRWLVKLVFVPLLAVHVVEAAWMARSRLAKHGVEAGSALWWKWVAAPFFEGVPAIWRFDALVEAERKKLESAKH